MASPFSRLKFDPSRVQNRRVSDPNVGRPREPLVFYMLFLICLALAICLAYRAFVISNTCEVETSVVPAVGAFPRAEVVETDCDGFGGSDVVEIFVRPAGGGNSSARTLVFKYDPSSFSGPVHLSWSGANHLAISIDRVDGIDVRETQIPGYIISYRIGAIGPKVSRTK